MGNCLMRNNKISSAQDHDKNYISQVAPCVDVKVEKTKASSSSSLPKLEAPEQKEQGMKKKKVRFNMQNDDDDGDDDRGSSSHVVRIKVVMTRKELKRMLLSCQKDEQHTTTTSLEQLLRAVKLRGGRISTDVCEFNGGMNSWRPDLESIPEDSLIFDNPST